MAAMVAASSEHGYAGATVSRVVEGAGVSRATFYEHFCGREECFRATYRVKVEAVRQVVSAAAAAAGPAERPEAVLEALLDELSTDWTLARILLIEALGAPAGIRDEHEGLIDRIEAEVAAFLDDQPRSGAIQLPAAALVAGIADAIARRALEQAGRDLRELRADLGRWIDTYRLPAGVQPLPQQEWRQLGRFERSVHPERLEGPTLLPRGRSAWPPERAADARRLRILEATAALSYEKGFDSLTVAEIAARARIPRAAFYSQFAGKREALMAAQTRGLQGAMAVAAAEYSPAAAWPQRVWRMTRAFLTFLAETPHYAHLDFVESYTAGCEAVRHRQQNHMAFALFLEDGYRRLPEVERLPPVCMEALAGAVLGLIRKQVVAGRSERMLSLLPAAAYTILTPFIGPQEAAAQVQVWARGAR